MQFVFATLIIISIVLTGCGIKGNPDPLALSDLIFDQEDFEDDCFLTDSTADSINPIVSSDRQYIEDFMAPAFDDEELTLSAQTVLSCLYQVEDESSKVGLFGIKFDSGSKADDAADFLKEKHVDESMNLVYDDGKIVIWLWQESSSTEECFEKLEDLVEYELRKHDFPIPKHF